MKVYGPKRLNYIICIIIGILMLVSIKPVWSAEFCVDNAIDFQNALNAAANNDDHDVTMGRELAGKIFTLPTHAYIKQAEIDKIKSFLSDLENL